MTVAARKQLDEPLAVSVPVEQQGVVELADPLAMQRGGLLHDVVLSYESWGSLSPEMDNVILLFTGLSASPHVASHAANPEPGWWEFMLGEGKAIDTSKYFVICFNTLGSCFGSTGPASLNPDTQQPYQANFPSLSVEDMARACHQALEQLGIKQLHTLMGVSLGGMTALAYATLYPSVVKRMVNISGAAQAEPYAIGLRSLQREIIRNDPAWQGGFYEPGKGPIDGMRMARKLGLMSYRSSEEYQQRFARERIEDGEHHQEPFALEFQVESYLDFNARRFIENFDANSYLYLSRAMDWFDLADYGGSVNAALAKLPIQQALIIGVESDALFPLRQQKQMADGLEQGGCEVHYHAFSSLQGHDAFLVDEQPFTEAVASFFSTIGE